MNSIEVVSSSETLATRLAPLRKQMAEHPLYAHIQTIDDAGQALVSQ